MERVEKFSKILYYIFEEIVYYIELTSLGFCKTIKWENIKTLLNIAKANNELSEEQVNYIIYKYSRENRK